MPWNDRATRRDHRNRQGQRGIYHATDLSFQEFRGAIDSVDIAGHGFGIASVSFEVKRDGNVARLCQGEGIGLHELPRSCKAMGDDDDRCPGSGRVLIDRRRRRTDFERCHRETGPCALQIPEAGAAQHQTGEGRQQAQIDQVRGLIPQPHRAAVPSSTTDRKVEWSRWYATEGCM